MLTSVLNVFSLLSFLNCLEIHFIYHVLISSAFQQQNYKNVVFSGLLCISSFFPILAIFRQGIKWNGLPVKNS